MKLMHLSDLHLGKRVNEFSMIEDQKFILKAILSIINDEKPDGIMVAGDVYDRSIPTEDAMKLWDEFLIRLADKKIPVFAISGNHDSVIRFADHGALVETTGIHLAPQYDGNVKKCVMEDENGQFNIYMLPFIKPANVRALFPDEEINDYTDACRVAINHMGVDTNERNILIAHQMIVGSARCDSEDVSVGGLDGVDVSVFDAFDYVALGHLHGPQHIGRETVRYSGTPLKYSFSEKDHKKSVTIVEFGAKGDIRINEVPLKPMHDLREIKGTYDELMNKKNYEGTATDDYIHAVLTDENDVIDAMAKLRVVYPNIMKLSYENKRTKTQQVVTDVEDVERKTPIELFDEFYEKQNNQKMSDEQRKFVLEQIEAIWEE
ncbi:MAG: exonuclease SbcCD subunit D [Lachnospiraceae bacterium]|nr:exonuclease SbcCD subunit D [Lachnospiraceae bacterium]